MDTALDNSDFGPHWLREPRVAAAVVDGILYGCSILHLFALHAFVVMPNHVHISITPHSPIRRITNGPKGSTARQANRILRRTARPFWQDESYDHWVRDEHEFNRICSYIEWNPVFAALVARPQDWPWSSLARQFQHSLQQ